MNKNSIIRKLINFTFYFMMIQNNVYCIELTGIDLDKDKSNYNLDLNYCIKLATKNAIDILKQKSSVELNGAEVLKSYASFLPNLTSQASYNYTTGTLYTTTATPAFITGDGTFSAITISSDFNIFNGFSDYASLNSYLLKKDSSELTLTRVKQKISLDIAQSFLQVILDNKMIEIAKQNFEESQAREKLLEAQSRVGSKSISDYYLQQAQTSSADSFLQTSENKLRNDELILLQKLRLDIKKNYKFIEINLNNLQEDKNFENESQLIKVALNKRIDLKSINKLKKSAEYDVQNTQSGYLPKLDFVVSTTSTSSYLNTQTVNGINVVPPSQSPITDQLSNQVKYYIGINFTWNIFDRLVTYANESQSRTMAYQIKLDEENLYNQIIVDARTAFGNYKLALQNLDSSYKGLFASEKAYQVMSGRYKVGSASFVDLSTAQSTLVQAQSTRAQALINFKLQNWNVKYATGELEVL
ncbi:TolC family protein [Silvanigrella aquatica]|uniref:TolC family protein n=1 Tax=Silvanigrella aquatica TaxID=1915309 RepID=A0A1L4D260_9BACT|nr:TolC family protein [Silvanigrella aquatica]APJ04293.1 hypothetical protein AXG55_10400 [Silvanigrella aquatica]